MRCALAVRAVEVLNLLLELVHVVEVHEQKNATWVGNIGGRCEEVCGISVMHRGEVHVTTT